MEFVFENKLFLNRFRVLEKIRNKIDSAKCATFFNLFCLKDHIAPKYSKTTTCSISATNRNAKVEDLLQSQIVQKERELKELQARYAEEMFTTTEDNFGTDVHKFLQLVNEHFTKSERVKEVKIVKKLSRLYGGLLLFKQNCTTYVNLSDYKLSDDECDFLMLGYNYHLRKPYDL